MSCAAAIGNASKEAKNIRAELTILDSINTLVAFDIGIVLKSVDTVENLLGRMVNAGIYTPR